MGYSLYRMSLTAADASRETRQRAETIMSRNQTSQTAKYSIDLDGDIFSMSSERAARVACEASPTGGTLIAPDGTRTRIAPKTQTVVRHQSVGNFNDGGLT